MKSQEDEVSGGGSFKRMKFLEDDVSGG